MINASSDRVLSSELSVENLLINEVISALTLLSDKARALEIVVSKEEII